MKPRPRSSFCWSVRPTSGACRLSGLARMVCRLVGLERRAAVPLRTTKPAASALGERFESIASKASPAVVAIEGGQAHDGQGWQDSAPSMIPGSGVMVRLFPAKRAERR